jgi:hypothetical protein
VRDVQTNEIQNFLVLIATLAVALMAEPRVKRYIAPDDEYGEASFRIYHFDGSGSIRASPSSKETNVWLRLKGPWL